MTGCVTEIVGAVTSTKNDWLYAYAPGCSGPVGLVDASTRNWYVPSGMSVTVHEVSVDHGFAVQMPRR